MHAWSPWLVALSFQAVACASSPAATTPADGGSSLATTSSTGASTSTGGDGGGGASKALCETCGRVTSAGGLANAAITEASGIVPSAVHAGAFYVQNDSGDTARFFAIDEKGADLGTFDVTGASAVDWEDIARGPCPQGSCLYLADIGDNAEKRASCVLYRVPEPAALGAGAHAIAMEALPFTYPDGSHNAEALLVHPTTGVVTIVTKTSGAPSIIFEFPMPLTPGRSAVLIKRGELTPVGQSPRVTGGDAAARGVLLRTYSDVLAYAMGPEQSVADALLGAPCVAPVALEKQGEAVAFLADGSGYVTVSEGEGAAVNQVACPP